MRILLLLLPAMLVAQAPQSPAPQAPRTSSSQTKTVPRTPASRTAQTPRPAAPLTTDEQKTIYALGLQIYNTLGTFDLSPAELQIIERAMSDAEAKKPAVDITVYGPKIEPLARARAAEVAQKQKAVSEQFLAKAAAEPGAVRLASGLIFRDITPGTGASPAATDTVKVNYRGTFVDGQEFDSSYKRGQPAEFRLNQVIPCWTEGVQRMKVGGKAELVCPSTIAYGDMGRPGIPGGATLIFQIELLGINSAPTGPAPVPPPPVR